MRHDLRLLAAAALLAFGAFVVAPVAQTSAPDIPFESNPDFLKFPETIHLGEAAGVATNSKGHVFVYMRTGAAHATVGTSRTFYKAGSRLFEFDQNGKFVREIGQGVYGFNFAQAVRIDPQDNIWVVDQGSSQVIKLDPEGRVLLVMSRKPEAISVRAAAPEAGRGGGGGGRGPSGAPGSGIPGDNFTRTSDVAWDRAGNIYVADGMGYGTGNARVAKFDKDGHFLKSWGSRGGEPGQFDSLHGIAIDGTGNVYVADAGNKRIQVFDPDGNFRAQITNIGVPAAICMTAGPHQYLYSSNSNDPETLDNGEIYKLELDGRVAAKFGRAGKLPKEFGMVNSIDCRNENDIYVGELMNWRVQRLSLHPAK
jgi:DNA-binding beta-propeller fold protein YncE